MNIKKYDKKILVTKPLIPPLVEYIPYLEEIWESGFLTNGGLMHDEFERQLGEFLGVKHICLLSSGTLALAIALKSLNLKGEVITTPFTHVSTAQAIYWNNLEPVFVDIDAHDLNIDTIEIERAITSQTSAILPVHVFGNPCKVEEINKLAQKYHLKVIYDAAHCFGVEFKGESIVNFGDLSILSFHATKVFNSTEGGAIICHDERMKKYIDALKNNGIDANGQLMGYGLNAKLNEIQAAFGLVQLKHVNKAIVNRKVASKRYSELISNLKGVSILIEQEFVKYNYSYFPIIINSTEFGSTAENIVAYLEANNVFPKRYFYPLVNDYKEFSKYKRNNTPISENISENIICLPLSHEIQSHEIEYIVSLLSHLHK
jgi:dTDP-4-amino-4,6-dideoxygalactose transaminase